MMTRHTRYLILLVLLTVLAALAACQPAARARSAATSTARPLAARVPAGATHAPPTIPPPPTAVPTGTPLLHPPTDTATPVPTNAPTPTQTVRPTAIPYKASLPFWQTAAFAGAAYCQSCHSELKDAAGKRVSLIDDWRSTTMANSARDPFWQAKVSSEINRAPALATVIEDKCANCHMPMAEAQAKADGAKPALPGRGFLDPENALHDPAMEGVSCTLCHRIEAKNLGTKASFSGGYQIDTAAKTPDRPLYGPYPTPVQPEMMQATAGYKPLQGLQLLTPQMCATCHNLYAPYVDAQGKVLGEFAEQTPYTEWQLSSFATAKTTCVACHLPAAGGAGAGVAISTMPGALPTREPFGKHQFAGGNALVLAILAEHGAELGVTADPAQFAATIAWVDEMVGKRSANLKLVGLERSGGKLYAELQVSTLTGHKFPTSLPVRRAWLHVTVTDQAGKVVFESGKVDSEGRIAGDKADEQAALYEPHYDLIKEPDQVQIYEGIMGDSDGQVTYTLLRAAKFLKDNRLLPAGFDKSRAPADVAVYGEATKDATFMGGSDTITYEVSVPATGGPFTVRAELLYQPIAYRFVQDMAGDGTELTQRFLKFYAEAIKTPELVAEIAPVVVK